MEALPPDVCATFDHTGGWAHSLLVTKPVVPTRVRLETLRSVLVAEPLCLSPGAAMLVESAFFRAWPRLVTGTYLDSVAMLEDIACGMSVSVMAK